MVCSFIAYSLGAYSSNVQLEPPYLSASLCTSGNSDGSSMVENTVGLARGRNGLYVSEGFSLGRFDIGHAGRGFAVWGWRRTLGLGGL
jgi:hypothetical protein